MSKRIRWLSLVIAIFFVSTLFAADQTDYSDEWEWNLAPYFLWAIGIQGTVTVKGNEAAVDITFGDVQDELAFFFDAYLEGAKGNHGFIFEPTFIQLESEAATPFGKSEVDTDITLVEGVGIRRFRGPSTSSAFQIIYGIRYWKIDTKIRLNGAFVAGETQDWVDGFVGGRVYSDLTDNWMLVARGDIGAGGSDLTWNISTLLVRSFQGRTSLAFGYRFLDVDYEDGSGTDLFRFDAQLSGPIVGINISWPKR